MCDVTYLNSSHLSIKIKHSKNSTKRQIYKSGQENKFPPSHSTLSSLE